MTGPTHSKDAGIPTMGFGFLEGEWEFKMKNMIFFNLDWESFVVSLWYEPYYLGFAQRPPDFWKLTNRQSGLTA